MSGAFYALQFRTRNFFSVELLKVNLCTDAIACYFSMPQKPRSSNLSLSLISVKASCTANAKPGNKFTLTLLEQVCVFLKHSKMTYQLPILISTKFTP
ncbi:hypothetical protein Cadr_000023343 [Camelus dromedarius]|uniref:Uncharacterized protein n=1 Tax=Camelus dromedarius TaxID=9838 RepID=A0A5N4CIB8_CAMDR|nr:hypothetical protein Cadr_000023343 [Camelus dromedarius]